MYIVVDNKEYEVESYSRTKNAQHSDDYNGKNVRVEFQFKDSVTFDEIDSIPQDSFNDIILKLDSGNEERVIGYNFYSLFERISGENRKENLTLMLSK